MHQGETKRQGKRSSTGGGGGVSRDDESWHKLGVIEVNAANEMEMWDAGG